MIYDVESGLGHPPINGAHRCGFSVSDLDRSIRFYCDVLGANLVRPPYVDHNPSFTGRMAIVGLGATGLHLFEHAGNEDVRFDPARTGLDHLGFEAGSVEDLLAWASWLDACNIAHSGVRDLVAGHAAGEPLGAMLDFVDPDGFSWSFCCSMQKSSGNQACTTRANPAERLKLVSRNRANSMRIAQSRT